MITPTKGLPLVLVVLSFALMPNQVRADDTSPSASAVATPSDESGEAAVNVDAENAPVVVEDDVDVIDPLATLDTFFDGLGEPIPLSQREPTLPAASFEVDAHFGLVGTAPTIGTLDLRFSIFDWWEFRLGVLPNIGGVMTRFRLGSVKEWGALTVDGGLTGIELGVLATEGARDAGVRAYFEGGASYTKALFGWTQFSTSARYRTRQSTLKDEFEHIVAGDARFIVDLPGNTWLSAGVAAAHSFTPVQENVVAFVEIDRPGLSHFLVRGDDVQTSVTIPAAFTYGLTDTLDVDVFVTPRVFPEFDWMLGAGLRFRILDPFDFVSDDPVVIDPTTTALLSATER